MADNDDSKIRFFVFVVESPSAPDLYHGRSEAGLVRQALALSEIPCTSRCVISREALEAALRIGLPEEMAVWKGRLPVLHISAHGGPDGIQLSNKEIITWAELKELLKPINKAFNGALLVCMSSCHGYAGSRMAMHPDESDLPFFALVGSGGTPTWSETAIAFATFYHLLGRGVRFPEALDAMRRASGTLDFFLTTAEDARKGYIEFLKAFNTGQATASLQASAAAVPPGRLEKLSSLEPPRT